MPTLLSHVTHEDIQHSHGHAKALQPLLFQLFGLEEELEAALSLVVREVESVGPLKTKTETKIQHCKQFFFFFGERETVGERRCRSQTRQDAGGQMEAKKC